MSSAALSPALRRVLPPAVLRGLGERLLRKPSSIPTWSHPRDSGIVFSLRHGYVRITALRRACVYSRPPGNSPHADVLGLKAVYSVAQEQPHSWVFPQVGALVPCPHPPRKCRNAPSIFLHDSPKLERDQGPQTAGVRREEDGVQWKLWAHVYTDRMPSRAQARGPCTSSCSSPGAQLSRQIEKSRHCQAVLLGWA